MRANSRPVESNQEAPHPRLAEIVERHLQTASRRPLAEHSRRAFAAFLALVHGETRPIALDSGCGIGTSSLALARRLPRHLVVGVDQSAARLAGWLGDQQLCVRRDRVIWLRCELAEFWRLALDCGLRIDRHYLLYPNPWPKAAHLMRRWHGHPAFADLLALGGHLELRSNWQLYVEEFAAALAIAGRCARVESFAARAPLTPFERKYRDSGHSLWRLRSRFAVPLLPLSRRESNPLLSSARG